jgi:pre-mRNA-splicing factor ISY1
VPSATGKGPGYRYLGAAKFFLDVNELFNNPLEVKKMRSRYEIIYM